jgi:pimeloyl-ACP methyl ester carboxylesterase
MAARRGWRTSSIDVEGGVHVRGLVRPPTRKDAPWILYFPGNSETQLAESQVFLDALCDGRDWGAAVYTYRGFDGSQGKPRWGVILRDADEVFLALREREKIPLERLHVVGFSLGTLSAVEVFHRRPASLTLLAPFTRVDMVGASLARRVWPEDYDLLRRARGITAGQPPILVMHGATDTVLPVAMGRTVAKAMSAQYIEVPDADHVGLLSSALTLEAVRARVGTGRA